VAREVPSFKEFFDLLGMPEVQEMEARYGIEEKARAGYLKIEIWRVAVDGRAVHVVPHVLRIFGRVVHHAAVVPEHEVVQLPALAVDVLRLDDLFLEPVED
jgi:hypothetical protein